MTIGKTVLLGFALRLTWALLTFFLNPDGIWVYDSFGYWHLGHNLLSHGTFSQATAPPFEPDFFRTPLYPLFLSLFQLLNAGNIVIIIAQVIISSATCYLTYRLAFSFTSNKNISATAALIIAIDIPAIIYTNFILTETLFVFLFIAFCIQFMQYLRTKKRKWLIYSSVILGMCILCRPVALYFPLILILLIFLLNTPLVRSCVHAFFFTITIIAILSPWIIRNKLAFGELSFTYMGKHSLLAHHAANIMAVKEGKNYFAFESGFRQQVIEKFRKERNDTGRIELRQPALFADYSAREAWKIIFDNPSIFLKEHFKNVFYFFAKPVRAPLDTQPGFRKTYSLKSTPTLFSEATLFARIMIVIQMIFLTLVYLACVKGTLTYNKEKILLLFLVIIILYFSNMTVPPFSDARLRMPVMPLIAVLAAIGLNKWIESRAFNRSRKISI